jgi:hypothetical protein
MELERKVDPRDHEKTELEDLNGTLHHLPTPMKNFPAWLKKQKALCETIYDFQSSGGDMEANWSSEEVEKEGM